MSYGTVDSTGDVGKYNAIVVDLTDHLPIIAYFSQGDYLSLSINAAGLATIAFYGNSTPADDDLVIAYQRLQVFLPLATR